jgi:hypothetical protein
METLKSQFGLPTEQLGRLDLWCNPPISLVNAATVTFMIGPHIECQCFRRWGWMGIDIDNIDLQLESGF